MRVIGSQKNISRAEPLSISFKKLSLLNISIIVRLKLMKSIHLLRSVFLLWVRVGLLIEWTPGTVRASTRKPVWIQEKQRNNRQCLHSTTASRKMSGTECGPLHDLCRPYQSIWHSQSWGTLENYGKVWLSSHIHSNGAAVPWWYACKGLKWWRVF